MNAGPPTSPGPRSSLELVLPSSAEHLAFLRACAQWFCEYQGISATATSRAVLGLVEAVSNVIRHAYGGSPHGSIQVRFRASDEALEFELIDDGRSVPPATIEASCATGDEHGGRGILLMKKCMDGLRYEQRPEGGGRLVLTMGRDPPLGRATAAESR